MNKFFKTVALFAVLCMLISGCGKSKEKTSINQNVINDDNVTASGVLPIVKDKVSLTLGVLTTPKITDYETNAFTKFLEEKTNIDLNFYPFPSGGAMEKLNVMLGSNTELPEVIVGFNIPESTFLKYADQGVFLKLNDYIDKYGYYTSKMIETSQVKDLTKYLKSADGNYYYVPSLREQLGNNYGGKAWINKKWLDKLGLQMPTTTDEFEKVMKAFKTMDPNGNGKQDEIGFTGSKDGWNEKPFNFLINSFIYDDYGKRITVDDNGKISYAYTQNEFKNAVKYLNKLVNEDLVDVQAYTQDNKTLVSIANNDDNVLGAFASGSPDVLFSKNLERLQDYVPLPPLKGPQGVAYTYKAISQPKCAGVITKYCKNPLAAYRLLDYMLSEEATIFNRYGVEGKDWKKASATDVGLFENIGVKPTIVPILQYGVVQNSHWYQQNPEYRFSQISDGMAWDGNKLNGEYVKANAITSYIGKEPKNLFTKSLLNLEEMDEFNNLSAAIHPYAQENISMFILGRRNVDTEWNKFMSELDGMGIKRYTELTQIGYDRFEGKIK